MIKYSISFYVCLILLNIVHRMSCQTWNYGHLGPDVWSDTYPSCAKHSQSPINIKTACTSYQSFTPFHFTSTYDLRHNFTLLNNGHTIVGRYTDNDSSPLILTGGGLNGTYYFLNFHLHWGENYKSGSEHQINGVKYSGEIHFVHINPETNQLAVLGMFMESSPNTTLNETTEDSIMDEWKRYFAAASENLQETNNSIILSLNLSSLIGDNLDDFWRYEGSLTIPPCTEGVIWTVFKTPTMFTESELGAFRNNILSEDYRGPQPLYNRIVYRNFINKTLSSIPDYDCCSKSLDNSSRRLLNQNPFSLLSIEGLKYTLSLIIILYYCSISRFAIFI